MTVFLRLLAEDDKPQALLAAVREAGRRSSVCCGQSAEAEERSAKLGEHSASVVERSAMADGHSAIVAERSAGSEACSSVIAEHSATSGRVFEVEPEAFALLLGSPFAYWVSEAVRGVFVHGNMASFTTKLGLKTDDDFRFIRYWVEVYPTENRWTPFAKGGSFSLFYSDVHLVLNWQENGWELKSLSTERWGNAGKRIFNAAYYFRPGLTWPRRTNGLSFRVMPAGCIFADKGPAAFVEGDDPNQLLALAALMNSSIFGYLVSVQLARTELAQSYEVGIIQNTPVPDLDAAAIETLANLARRAWSLKRTLDTITETSHAFVLPTVLRSRVGPFDPAAITLEIAQIQAEIDRHAFALYGIADKDREAVVNGQCPVDSEAQSSPNEDDEAENAETDHSPLTINHCSPSIDHLLSWAIGVAFGRFDPRLAEGVRPLPAEPEPFDPLPPRSPGMMPDDSQVRAVLVDDPGHRDDITAAVLAVLERVDIPDALRPSVEACRAWLARAFFPLHIKLYSKSRRKAPIYWQLATPSAGYSVWLYLHGFSKDTLYQVQNDYAAPKLGHEERKLEALRTEIGASPTAAELRSLAEQELLVGELRGFLEEVKRVAPLWNPNLDDGVVITSAPLWRLFPQQKAWQKELKATWDSLCDGAYDWAHLAMHLWPERVVPQCVTDRSFAIAHGLEDLFWVGDYAQRWRPRVGETETTAYLAQYWHCPSLAETLAELETFWQGHANDPGSDNPSWWEDLASGVCDDQPMALALWPTRVLEKCLADEKLFKSHGLTGKTLHGRGTPLEKLLRQYPSRHSTADLQRLAAFCGLRGSRDEWSARWANFAEGNLDQEPLALRVHTLRVVEQAKKDYDFAVLHDLARWFWLTTPLNSRRLSEPKAEQDREIRQRESLAVKAALLNLLDASQPSNAQRTPKQRKFPA